MCLEVNRVPEKKFLTNCLESYADCLIRMEKADYAYRLLDMNRKYLKSTMLKYLFGKAAHICKDYQTAAGFLTGITDAADFEQLGEDVYDAYTRIFAIYQQTQETEKAELYKKKLVAFANAHGKNITFT